MEPKSHYFNHQYMRRERLLSYIDQISVLSLYADPNASIIEVGKGNGYLSHMLRSYYQYQVKTLDFNPDLEPDILADICADDFNLVQDYDIGLCFEVLEHLPWDRLTKVMNNLLKSIRKVLIVSVPNTNYFLQFKLNTLFKNYTPLNLTFTVPRIINNKKIFGSDHKWELGINDNNGRRVKPKHLINDKFGKENVLQNFRGREMPGHHYFIIKGRLRDE
jgi:hypothetical protein